MAGRVEGRGIVVTGATERTTVRIMNRGEVCQVGSLTIDGDVRNVQLRGVDVVGEGIEIEGAAGRVDLARLRNGADVHVGGNAKMLRVESVGVGSEIDVEGDVNVLMAGEFVGATWTSRSLGRAMFQGAFVGELEVTQGDLGTLAIREGDLVGAVNVAGSIGSVQIKEGNLPGSVWAGDDIARILAPRGCVTGTIEAGRTIERIVAEETDGAEIRAGEALGRVDVRGDMFETIVAVGSSAAAGQTGEPGEVTEAFLSSLRVGGTFGGSTVAVGVTPDAEGCFITGSAASAAGTIGRVDLGAVATEGEGDPFGVVARDAIDQLLVGREKLRTGLQWENFYVEVLEAEGV